jgi:glucose-1-phosphate thymidylyltransferase
VILCAGEGTRLRPLTYSRPKALLPVAGRPFLDWVLSDIAGAGVEAACVVASPVSERAMAEYLGDGARWRLEIALAIQDPPLGLAHATASARDFVADDPFLLYLGDNLLEDDLGEFVRASEHGDSVASVVVKRVTDPSAYGVVVAEGGRAVRLIEKPKDPPSDLAITGVYAFGPSVFDAIDAIQPSARGEYEITDAVQHMADHIGPVTTHIAEGYWLDVGRPAWLLEANRRLLRELPPNGHGAALRDCLVGGSVSIEGGTVVESSRLIGPIWVGEGAEVRGATLGPNVSVGRGCRIEGAGLTNGVVMAGTTIVGFGRGVRDSLIGRRCVLTGPPGARLSKVQLADGSLLTVH